MQRPDGLLAKHSLLCAVIDAEWATRLDHKIARHIIERYRSDHGNARASLRFLAVNTSADRTNVISSLRRLIEHGAFSVLREGSGTRPTEYGLNFDFTPSGVVGNTTSSGVVSTTSSGVADTTSKPPSGVVGNTESHLLVPVTTGDKVRRSVSAAPGDGAEGAAPAVGFEDGWKAYGRRGNKKASRAAWGGIDWDQYDYGPEHVIVRARSWAGSVKPGQRRMPFEKWLEAEKFDEADRKAASTSCKAPATPANDNADDDMRLPPKPIDTHWGTIETADVEQRERKSVLCLRIDGKSVEITLESHDSKEQERGQREFGRLSSIADKEIDDTEDLVGLSVRWSEMSDGTRKWGAA